MDNFRHGQTPVDRALLKGITVSEVYGSYAKPANTVSYMHSGALHLDVSDPQNVVAMEGAIAFLQTLVRQARGT